MRILVADDSSEILGFFSRCLSKGHDLTLVEDGNKAIEKAGAEDFDIIFLDYYMPGLTGVDTCKIIKQLKPGSKVIIMSGSFPNENDFRKSIEKEYHNLMEGFLYKPFYIENLQKCLRNTCENKNDMPLSSTKVI